MNIAIVEDLLEDREKLSSLLQVYFSENCIEFPLRILSFESGETFLAAFATGDYDIVFLDYYMDGLNGLDTALKIREKDVTVRLIFTTTTTDYAIASFKVQASGYLLKPYTYQDLFESMQAINLQQIQEKHYIKIRTGTGMRKLFVSTLLYCDMDGHYVQFHTMEQGILRSRMAFCKVLTLLDPYECFLNCYRGCLLNMDWVDYVEGLDFCLLNGERVPFRRREQSKLIQTYADYMFQKARARQP